MAGSAQKAPPATMGKREVIVSLLVIVAVLVLAVNFLISIPVSVGAAIASVVSAVTARDRRRFYIALSVISGLILAAGIPMAVFLLPSGETVSTVTTVFEPDVTE